MNRSTQMFVSCILIMFGMFATACWSTNTMSSEVNGRKTMETRAEYGPWGSDLHVKRDTSRYENYKAEIGDMGGAEDDYARERIHAEERTRVWGNTPYAGFYNQCVGFYGQGHAGYCDDRTHEYQRCLERIGNLPNNRERELCLDQVMVHERRGTWGVPAPYYGTGNYLYGW